MVKTHDFVAYCSTEPVEILETVGPTGEYVRIDFSAKNVILNEFDISNHASCQEYIATVLNVNESKVAYGGYLEKRSLYSGNATFNSESMSRNIHLGMDFWAKAGTKVIVPLNGRVHSFKNNSMYGDYGPTIILEHEVNNLIFYSLYGHLSVESLDGLYEGKKVDQGETLAFLGSPEINVGYAPHLHFQLILDLQGKVGDYPGVCAEQDLDFYSKNCPDPNLLLKIHE